LALLGLAFLAALSLSLYLAVNLIRGRVVGEPAAGVLAGPTSPGWAGESRVTILLLGVDTRESGPDVGPGHTDTMILMSLDPLGMTVGMLSIPRDLWVNIPGFGSDKIDMAYFEGEAYRLPGGGPALATETVQNFLGIPVNYYVVVDFSAFTTMIDDLGGIDVNVPESSLKIHPLGAQTPLHLHHGMNHLDGAAALAYARDRDSPGGDFDRVRRQQQVIYAIRDKVLNLNMLPTLLTKAPALYSAFSSGVQTNLTLNQILALARTAKDIPPQNITSGILGPDQLQSMTAMNGLDVLIPDQDKARQLANQVLFASGSPVPPQPPISPATLAPKEGAQIELVNGSGVVGLASATRDFLVKHGFTADKISLGNASVLYPSTQIIDFRGMPYTVEYLTTLLSISPSNVLSQQPPAQGVDVEVILGADWQIPQN